LYDAGARRYLLRIESSNPELYAALHPDAMSWQRRVDCLNSLKKIGYMVRCYIAICQLLSQMLRCYIVW
jgi:biotin synthase-like enzyme